MILAGCEPAVGGGDNTGTNNNGNNNDADDPPAPTTGTLVITNTALENYILRVEIRESGEDDVVRTYNGAPVGKDKTVEFTLPPGAYDIQIRDDWTQYPYFKNAVTVKLGQSTHLTFNGFEIL
jgi:hypothetical protein